MYALVFHRDEPIGVLFFVLIQSMFMFGLNGHLNPYHLKSAAAIDFLEEITVMITLYNMICFTDFVDNPESKDVVGISLVGFTCTSLLYSLSR